MWKRWWAWNLNATVETYSCRTCSDTPPQGKQLLDIGIPLRRNLDEDFCSMRQLMKYRAEVRSSFITTTVRDESQVDHKGATVRVRTGDQLLPVLCHCQRINIAVQMCWFKWILQCVCGSVTGLWGCMHTSWGRKNVFHNQLSSRYCAWLGSRSLTSPITCVSKSFWDACSCPCWGLHWI